MRPENKLRDKSYRFAIRAVNLYKHLSAERRELVLSKQMLRSATSIGANIHEAEHAQSRPDFLSKLNISLKEASETAYWLRLLKDTSYLNEAEFSSMKNDCDELVAMLAASVKTLRDKN